MANEFGQRSATQTDNAVAILFPIHVKRALDAGDGRVWRDTVIDGDVGISGQRGANDVDDAMFH